jgi:hypothetical protein
MNEPPSYPRIPHLVPGRGTQDDRVLGPNEADAFLTRPVLVEEKLDGANVVVWLHDGRVECALRSGSGAQDRGRQLGPLRAWLAERTDRLRVLLDERALYAEWLLVAHGVRYDALSAYLVGLDLWSPTSGFVAPDIREELLTQARLVTPPELHRGPIGSIDRLEGLLGRSHAGSEPMEGVVVRTLDGREPRIAKLLRSGFSPATDAAWRRGRPRNLLRETEFSWH